MKSKIDQSVLFREHMNGQNYHKALFLLSEIRHPALLKLFPRLSKGDIKRDAQSMIEVTMIDLNVLRKYIIRTRLSHWMLAIFSMSFVLIDISIIIWGLVLWKHSGFVNLMCLGFMLTPVVVIPTYASIMMIRLEIKSKFYSAL